MRQKIHRRATVREKNRGATLAAQSGDYRDAVAASSSWCGAHLHRYILEKRKARSLSFSHHDGVKRPVAKSRSLPWNVAGSCPPRSIPRLRAVAASQRHSSRRSWASSVVRFISPAGLVLSRPHAHVWTWLRVRVARTRISKVRKTGSVQVVGRQRPRGIVSRTTVYVCVRTYLSHFLIKPIQPGAILVFWSFVFRWLPNNFFSWNKSCYRKIFKEKFDSDFIRSIVRSILKVSIPWKTNRKQIKIILLQFLWNICDRLIKILRKK